MSTAAADRTAGADVQQQHPQQPQQQQQQQQQDPQQQDPQQPQEQPLLMSPEQQQQLLDAVKDRPPVIFYHYPCPDGVFAALAATLYFQARGVTPRYVPFEVYRDMNIQDLNLQPEAVAFLLDYSGPGGFPQQLAQHVSQVVVLDHHKTAAEQLADVSTHPPNLAVCLDMQRSGAAIARDFFKPQGMSSSLQDIFRWVEDADLWRWVLPDSQAFHAGLAALRVEYHAGRNPGIWQQLQELDVAEVLRRGTTALAYQQQLISSAVAASQPYQLGGAQGLTKGWGVCMGCEVSGDLVLYRSRLGNTLAQHSREKGLAPVGLIAYTETDQPNKERDVKVSLRSTDGYDTSSISAAFGGGGHAAASSCIITREQLKSWRDTAH